MPSMCRSRHAGFFSGYTQGLKKISSRYYMCECVRVCMCVCACVCVCFLRNLRGLAYLSGRREQVARCFTRGEINLTGVSSSRRHSSQKQTLCWLARFLWHRMAENSKQSHDNTHTHTTHTHTHTRSAQGQQPTAVSSLAAGEWSRFSSWRQCCFLISGASEKWICFSPGLRCNPPLQMFVTLCNRFILQPGNLYSVSLLLRKERRL